MFYSVCFLWLISRNTRAKPALWLPGQNKETVKSNELVTVVTALCLTEGQIHWFTVKIKRRPFWSSSFTTIAFASSSFHPISDWDLRRANKLNFFWFLLIWRITYENFTTKMTTQFFSTKYILINNYNKYWLSKLSMFVWDCAHVFMIVSDATVDGGSLPSLSMW